MLDEQLARSQAQKKGKALSAQYFAPHHKQADPLCRDHRHRKSEKEEDEELLKEEDEEDEAIVFEESPPCERLDFSLSVQSNRLQMSKVER